MHGTDAVPYAGAMSESRMFKSGSHEAQHLIRRRIMPEKELGSDLVFPPEGDGGGESVAPPWVLARHHQRRFMRYMRYAAATAGVLIVAAVWYQFRYVECFREGLCYDTGWGGTDMLNLVIVSAVLVGVAMFMVANTFGQRAVRAEAAALEAERQRRMQERPDQWRFV